MTDSDPLVPRLALVLGAALVVLGVGAYVVSDFASLTALIPALFGVLIAILGGVTRDPERRRLGTLGVGALAALGVLGSARVVPDLVALLSGDGVDSTVAVASQSAMILIGLVLLAAVVFDLRRQ